MRVTIPLITLLATALSVASETMPRRFSSQADSIDLAVAKAVTVFNKEMGETLWPGYNLANRPMVLYVPDKWALFLNAKTVLEGFVAYPDNWPALAAPANLHWGRYKDLAGQLAFDFSINDLKTVAIPLPNEIPTEVETPILNYFAFVEHEAFHQFQRETFADINETESEEHYPILDAENSALVAIEMRLLMEAVEASATSAKPQAKKLAESFLAVRRHRWFRDSTIAHYERVKELIEGTAKYIEVRAVGLMSQLCRDSSLNHLSAGVCNDFKSTSFFQYLLSDFKSRLHDHALGPRDVARNRIYPTASAICLLLDDTEVAWKIRVEKSTDSVSLAGLLQEGLRADTARFEALVNWAKQRYQYRNVLAATKHLILQHEREYRAAISNFERQQGIRVQVELAHSGLSRSRSCSGARWVMKQGGQVLSEQCAVYTLRRARSDDLFLEIRNSGVLEEALDQPASKRVIFFTPRLPSVTFDGQNLDKLQAGAYRFSRIALMSDNFSLQVQQQGTLCFADKNLMIRFAP